MGLPGLFLSPGQKINVRRNVITAFVSKKTVQVSKASAQPEVPLLFPSLLRALKFLEH